MVTRTLTGPNGLRVELDSSQIFPDDPGQGTPAMVYLGKHSATFWCAVDTGDLDCGEHTLTDRQFNWLGEQADIVAEFIEENTEEA